MEIHTLRKKINDKLGKMEKLLDEEVDYIHDGKINSEEQSIKDIDAIVSTLNTRLKNLQDVRNMNESELFVQQKLATSSLKKSSESFGVLTISKTNILVKLVPSKEFGQILAKEDAQFGKIAEVLIPKPTKHAGDVNVRLQNDEKACLITDMCLTSSGDIVMTDRNNQCLKKLCQKYSVEEHLYLSDNPFALCEVDRSTLAVTLYHEEKIQFVFQNPMALGTSFPVEDCCRGIMFQDGELYVCCGGWKEKGEGEARICVYTTTGDLLRLYCFDDFSIPSRIKASQTRKLKRPIGSTEIGDYQFIYAGNESNNIVLISEDGAYQEELLNENDGIVEPGAVCYDVKRSILIVSMQGSDVLKTFKIEFEQ